MSWLSVAHRFGYRFGPCEFLIPNLGLRQPDVSFCGFHGHLHNEKTQMRPFFWQSLNRLKTWAKGQRPGTGQSALNGVVGWDLTEGGVGFAEIGSFRSATSASSHMCHVHTPEIGVTVLALSYLEICEARRTNLSNSHRGCH